jgi:hypothetical protein
MVMYVIGLFLFAIGALAGTAGHMSPTSPVTIVLAVFAALVVLAVMLLWVAMLMAAYSTAFAVMYRDQCQRKEMLSPFPPHLGENA